MGEASDSINEETYKELLGFLQDPKPEVQRLAAEGVVAQSDQQEFLEYCTQHPRLCAKPLLRLIERAEADAKGETAEKGRKSNDLADAEMAVAGCNALQALVNLSQVCSVREEIVELNGPRRCAEALRAGWLEGRAQYSHWYAMLLANISTTQKGQEALCADESLFRFLFAAYIAKPRPEPRDGYDDPLLCLGKVLCNVCVLPEGRSYLVGGEQGASTLTALIAEVTDRSRRLDVLNIFRNLCIDTENHSTIVATDLFASMSTFLYPWEKVEAERRGQLPEELRAKLEDCGAVLTGDVAVRNAAASCMVGLCGTKEGRSYLREQGCYEILHAWLQEETEEETKTALETVIPAVQLSEEELQVEKDRLEGQAEQ